MEERTDLVVRAMRPEDLDATLDMWVAACGGRIVGALVVDPATGYLDQIVVASEFQGRGVGETLLAQVRSIAPAGLELHVNQDNARAIGFYRKHGFAAVGADVNPRSGAPTLRMRWRR